MTDWKERFTSKIGEGWFKSVSCGDGWKDLLLKLADDLDGLQIPYEIQQIKEKFGTLRFYASCQLSSAIVSQWYQRIAKPNYEPNSCERLVISKAKDGEDVGRALSDVFCEFIEIAESESHKICERCGASGKIRDGGWIKTFCDACNKKDKPN